MITGWDEAMRTQECRRKIVEAGRSCHVNEDDYDEIEKAYYFCEEPQHSAFADLPTRPIRALIRIKDEQVRDRAISSVKKLLELPKSQDTGRFVKSITEKEVKKIAEQAELEIRKELMEKMKKEREDSPIKEITQEEADAILARDTTQSQVSQSDPDDPPTSPKPKEPRKNSSGDVIYTDDEVDAIQVSAPTMNPRTKTGLLFITNVRTHHHHS